MPICHILGEYSHPILHDFWSTSLILFCVRHFFPPFFQHLTFFFGILDVLPILSIFHPYEYFFLKNPPPKKKERKKDLHCILPPHHTCHPRSLFITVNAPLKVDGMGCEELETIVYLLEKTVK